ncbi:Oidioi.mRNA.OKI2018_I69.PAR.g10493.t1.cds [Oikopleura dioica]|uniref:Oidioi.mRNA.OKI2018_I69.PAR.g10493.t1.cds n=1 Tax=Oikopleura dioica TaxID=34765 RepID=A0ABN7RRQ7_OIKDI|nr:Oidioi.mRNA.OKI2018_I69.PAR.g10493.t1.cds [Oikopleura dioica]
MNVNSGSEDGRKKQENSNKAFKWTAISALCLCFVAIVNHCVYGPLPECDLFFYRVLPLFDCVYIIGAIIGLIAAKMHSVMIYSFFSVSAVTTMLCYIINAAVDTMSITADMKQLREASVSASEVLEDDAVTGRVIDYCRYPENRYHGYKFDLIVEALGVAIHIAALLFEFQMFI